METWVLILLTLSISTFLKLAFDLLLFKFAHSSTAAPANLPPGPAPMSLIERLRFFGRAAELEDLLRQLRPKFGPIITLRFSSRLRVIFIFSRQLAHQALITNGATFAGRPRPPPVVKFLSCDQHNINSAGYGPTWSQLRRNLTAEILSPSRIRTYSDARKWVLDILLSRLQSDAGTGGVKAIDHFHYAMFCLLALMCFGDKLDEEQIKRIEAVHRQLLLSLERFEILNLSPALTRIVLPGRWRELHSLRQDQAEVVIPLIRARKHTKETTTACKEDGNSSHNTTPYVDTLLKLELVEDGEKRHLTEPEMLTLCSEFMNAGTDTTSTALQWVMANMVKYPDVQAKLYEEMKSTLTAGAQEVIGEDDLLKLPYLKAAVLEGVRRHPPAHFVLLHTVTEDTELGGYNLPKNTMVNFMVADMGWDPEVWEDPMEFKPERFLARGEGSSSSDMTGTREIKMMPFGVGRRMCPGYGLAMLHLEYFLANLVWKFEWKAVEGNEVDLSEKNEFTVVMKHPLRAQISERVK